MRKKTIYGYKFKEQDGICEITARAEINPYHIERILGKARVKGKKAEYEYIYIKSYDSDFEGVLLTERKNLNFDVVSNFITRYSNGVRTAGNHPYCADLKDDDLLDELGIEVLLYKHFFSMGSGLCVCYYPCKRTDITEELKEKLRERTREAENNKKSWDKCRENDRKRNKVVFEPYKEEGQHLKEV